MVQQGNDKTLITGMGMVTPVGGSAEQTCASLRAGVSRIMVSDDLAIPNAKGHKAPVICGAVLGITDGQRRFLRLLRMASKAAAEALTDAGLKQENLNTCWLYLGLPEQDRPGMDNRASHDLPRYLGNKLGARGLEKRCEVFTCGHASVFYAARQAMRDLVGGKCRHALVGCVDTYLDELTLKWLQQNNRLKTEDSPKGFVPGEGAAFFVLELETSVIARNARSFSRIGCVGITIEGNTMYANTPCRGEGLAASLFQTLANQEEGFSEPKLVLTDLNGERFRALEWGLVVPRVPLHLESPGNVWHPADCIGDVGAATGALNVCVAAVGMNKGYVKSSCALVWGASDYGDRGSCLVQMMS